MSSINLRYSDWKLLQVRMGFQVFYTDMELVVGPNERYQIYNIWGENGSVSYTTQIFKGSLPYSVTEYTQKQNDLDKADFEGGLKALSNSKQIVDVKLSS